MNSEGERSSLVLEKPNWDVSENADRCKIRSDRERESREEGKKASAVLRLTFAGKRLALSLRPVAQVRLSDIYVEPLLSHFLCSDLILSAPSCSDRSSARRSIIARS